MKRYFAIGGSIAVAVGLAIFMRPHFEKRSLDSEPPLPTLSDGNAYDRPATVDRQAGTSLPSKPSEQPPATALAEAKHALQTAQRDYDDATAALRLAENALDELEQEVEAVEQFVEEIQQRGDDPARHAEEGMRLLDPVIERYQARLKIVEAADERKARAQLNLSSAHAALAALEQ